jgi:hypothetical protein
MAIITNVIDERGFVYENQYVRIERAVITSKSSLETDLGVYFNKQLATDGQPPHRIETMSGEYDLLSSKNTWEQAYDLIKTRYHIHTDDI